MKALPLILFIILISSCGALLPEKKEVSVAQKKITNSDLSDVTQEYSALKVLEEKYRLSARAIPLAITRNLILDLTLKYPQAKSLQVVDPNRYRSLELTVEHLAHRETVKLTSQKQGFAANIRSW